MTFDGGYIRLWRSIKNHPVYFMTAEQRSVFITLLLEASWQESEYVCENCLGRYTLPPGATAKSQKTLAKLAAVKPGVVQRTIGNLLKMKTIRTESDKGCHSIIIFNNWEKWQSNEPLDERSMKGRYRVDEGPMKGRCKIKNNKNNKNNKKGEQAKHEPHIREAVKQLAELIKRAYPAAWEKTDRGSWFFQSYRSLASLERKQGKESIAEALALAQWALFETEPKFKILKASELISKIPSIIARKSNIVNFKPKRTAPTPCLIETFPVDLLPAHKDAQ